MRIHLSWTAKNKCNPHSYQLLWISNLNPGVSNPQPTGFKWLRMAMNAAQHKIMILLKTLWHIFVITCHNVFNVCSKTVLPVWRRDAKKSHTPVGLIWIFASCMSQFLPPPPSVSIPAHYLQHCNESSHHCLFYSGIIPIFWGTVFLIIQHRSYCLFLSFL